MVSVNEPFILTVRLCSPFNFVQGDPEFIEGSPSLHFVLRISVEGSEVEGGRTTHRPCTSSPAFGGMSKEAESKGVLSKDLA